MPVIEHVRQYPDPGSRLLRFRGDVVHFRMIIEDAGQGTGWLRTNIGSARITRKEIIAQVDKNESPMHHDWFDIPMVDDGAGAFILTLPLCEIGHFEAKAYFVPEESGQPVWPPGENTHINVEPVESVCANIVYNAFIRQFGPNKHARQKPPIDIDFKCFDEKGYILIPPSGTFRAFTKELDFIIDKLGCRYIQLLPINPTPTAYGRMGRYGSPYASQSFRLVDTAYAEFDLKATPMDQFIELVDAVHSRHAMVILDIAINHTGWGARLHEMYSHWLKRDEAGKIEMPGAWGVLWEDLTKLDYSKQTLWRFMAMVFLTWCKRGVDGFRCDAGYMIPKPAWRYIIARVREEYPDTIFFLEGLGGKISVTRDLLNTANLNWAYSELFQNYDNNQIHHYLPEANDISGADGVMINFAETHDNSRLAAVSTTYARMRTALCAMLSNHGGFAFANGVEWFATEKINVHDASSLNWGATENQVDHIRRLNAILKNHPAFFDGVTLRFAEKGDGNFLALLRSHAHSGKTLLILVNLDCAHPVSACWDPDFPGDGHDLLFDLISMRQREIKRTNQQSMLELNPGEVLCLSSEKEDMHMVLMGEKAGLRVPYRIGLQRLRSKVSDVYRYFYGMSHMGEFDMEAEIAMLKKDPAAYCRRQGNVNCPRVIVWQYPVDLKREVMVPPGYFLMVAASSYFEASILENGRVAVIEKGIENDRGGWFALFSPLDDTPTHRRMTLKLTIYNGKRNEAGGYSHETGFLMFLQDPGICHVRTIIDRNSAMAAPLTLMGVNRMGGVCRASTWWGHLDSKYDAFLGANINPEVPDNRWIMFTRCRGWFVYQDYSQSIRTDCIQEIVWSYGGNMKWLYRIPTGLGLHVSVTVAIEPVPLINRVRIHFYRHPKAEKDQLTDNRPVNLILRPDIESRSFHDVTKAYAGPEQVFPNVVSSRENGFVFMPDAGRRLDIDIKGSGPVGFVFEPEWSYMVHRPLEATRGLDPYSDLFSPGYLHGELKGGETLVLDAMVTAGDSRKDALPPFSMEDFSREQGPGVIKLPEAMRAAMDHFIVARQQLKSVIAGYPWFLDWGRDSLIFCRGLIEAGEIANALAIIRLFGQFEQNGTLPNMICGSDAANRDTSDAPLWFVIACRDLANKAGLNQILDQPCGGRTLRDTLFSIISGYINGTPNGVRMDPDTGLVFSPSHFTWMDTNFPASTPRQGYPVEIQALWYASIVFMAGIEPPAGVDKPAGIPLGDLAGRVSAAIEKYFYLPEKGFLSDCLHCGPGDSPGSAHADDALRPNQLFAITMGSVTDPDICENILDACSGLLVPGGIRSLADRTVDYPLEIHHDGKTLGDPYSPYKGRYQGDEDSSRKPAYHNGTAWTWVFPSFCEAWGMIYGPASYKTALAWLSSSTVLINEGCLGHVPEITDGDFPHTPRGCDAQAWSASELFRVFHLLNG